VDYFKPRGVPIAQLKEVVLTLDEFEAVRLADLDGLYQEEAAKIMGISRQTFGNIIESAHKKIADVVVNTKALRIEGGIVKMIQRKFLCYNCQKEWAEPYGTGKPAECIKCKSKNIHRVRQDMASAGGYGMGRKICRKVNI
jgi:predicted DNA-binding protein (UPF0251 family)